MLVASYPLSPLQRSTGIAPGLYLVSQQFPHFLFSFYRLQVEGFLANILRRTSPLRGPYSLYMSHSSYTVQRLSYFFFYWVALYYNYSLYSSYINIYVQQQNCRFTFQCGAQCSLIGPYSSIQVLVLQLSQQRQGAFYQRLAAQSQAPDLGAVQHYQSYDYYIQQAYKSKGGSLY